MISPVAKLSRLTLTYINANRFERVYVIIQVLNCDCCDFCDGLYYNVNQINDISFFLQGSPCTPEKEQSFFLLGSSCTPYNMTLSS